MYDGTPQRHAAHNRRRRPRTAAPVRSDRFAFWAVILAVVAMLGAATGSKAAGGGIGADGCDDAGFGQRVLRLGDCGRDVKTLNWILKSRSWGASAPLGLEFEPGTESSLGAFERKADLERDGVLDRKAGRALAESMREDVASWYGPGFFGNETACGRTLTRKTVGVAHRTLPCGTRVTIARDGEYLTTRVIDRGPYVKGVKWDLTAAAAKRIGLEYTEPVRSAIVR
jgi:hypothetical protein